MGEDKDVMGPGSRLLAKAGHAGFYEGELLYLIGVAGDDRLYVHRVGRFDKLIVRRELVHVDVSENKVPVGTRIKFVKTLTEQASGDHPKLIYAEAGDLGYVVGYNDFEGYMVSWDKWPQPFGSLISKEWVVDSDPDDLEGVVRAVESMTLLDGSDLRINQAAAFPKATLLDGSVRLAAAQGAEYGASGALEKLREMGTDRPITIHPKSDGATGVPMSTVHWVQMSGDPDRKESL